MGGEHVGCVDLLDKVKQLPELKLHVFGHIHNGYGHYKLGNTNFINASNCNEKYKCINPPIVIDLPDKIV